MSFLQPSLRWFGPSDPVPLAHLRQAGAEAIFTSLHHIPYGDPWPLQSIRDHKHLIEQSGLRWTVAESLPLHEDIKTGRGDLTALFRNYTDTLRHLAAEGIHTVIYNFMPVLDWVRTDMHHVLPDGARCLRYDPVHFAAFEIHALKRPGAQNDYTLLQVELANAWWQSIPEATRDNFIRTIIDVFPGVKWGLTLGDIRDRLALYQGIGPAELSANLARFLDAIIPVAEECGIRMAIHPDDPPFPVLGLPRIVSTSDHIDAIFNMAASPANGLCFCTGSFSARADNDLPAMALRFAPRIHAAHLRATERFPDGSFQEADHLGGSVDMPAVVRTLLDEQDRRSAETLAGTLLDEQDRRSAETLAGILLDEQDRRSAETLAGFQIPMRPDHGHVMMDDLTKPPGITAGYPAIGRMRGLAELRGLMLGLRSPR